MSNKKEKKGKNREGKDTQYEYPCRARKIQLKLNFDTLMETLTKPSSILLYWHTLLEIFITLTPNSEHISKWLASETMLLQH